MKIAKAVRRVRKGGWIARRIWDGKYKMYPIDTKNLCVLQSNDDNYSQRWQPSTEDLQADDWEVVWSADMCPFDSKIMQGLDWLVTKFPDLPLWLSLVALISSIVLPLLREFLATMP